MTAASTGMCHTPQPATVAVRYRPGVGIVHVGGDLDIATTPVLRSALAYVEASDVEVWVDLSSVAFMDASALGVLVESYGRAPGRGRAMRLVNAPARIVRLLQLAELDGLLRPAAVG
jgi:anti-anti-sigma factor